MSHRIKSGYMVRSLPSSRYKAHISDKYADIDSNDRFLVQSLRPVVIEHGPKVRLQFTTELIVLPQPMLQKRAALVLT
jgi:hypothetical protein